MNGHEQDFGHEFARYDPWIHNSDKGSDMNMDIGSDMSSDVDADSDS